MNKQQQIKEMPICVNCVHAYVCEEYNLYRDTLRKRCAYHNDHFLDIEQYKKQVYKETAEKFLQLAYDRCLEKSFIKKVEELAKQLGIEIKE